MVANFRRMWYGGLHSFPGGLKKERIDDEEPGVTRHTICRKTVAAAAFVPG